MFRLQIELSRKRRASPGQGKVRRCRKQQRKVFQLATEARKHRQVAQAAAGRVDANKHKSTSQSFFLSAALNPLSTAKSLQEANDAVGGKICQSSDGSATT